MSDWCDAKVSRGPRLIGEPGVLSLARGVARGFGVLVSFASAGEALGVGRDGGVEVLLEAIGVGAEGGVGWVVHEAEMSPLRGRGRERLANPKSNDFCRYHGGGLRQREHGATSGGGGGAEAAMA